MENAFIGGLAPNHRQRLVMGLSLDLEMEPYRMTPHFEFRKKTKRIKIFFRPPNPQCKV